MTCGGESKAGRQILVVASATAIVLAFALASIGCGEGAAGVARSDREAARLPAAVTSGPPPRGFRVDLRDQVHHARGLVKQPDGSYRSVCVDAPDGSLRLRGAGTGDQTGRARP